MNENIDNKFQEAFVDFQPTPPRQNWEQIQETMENEIDASLREKLQPLRVTPKAHVWKNIKEELPLHPGVKRYFGWMTKIAAVLVIGMLLSILSDQQQQELAHNEQEINQTITIPLQNSTEAIISNKETEIAFVYEVEKTSIAGKHPRTYDEKEEAEIKNLLQFILDDDDDDLWEFADEALIAKSLEPAETLTTETATAKLEETSAEEMDLEIKIPLIVVETEEEAANLIEIYESNHSSVQID